MLKSVKTEKFPTLLEVGLVRHYNIGFGFVFASLTGHAYG